MANIQYIYADAEEKYVKAALLYGKNADNYVYSTSACAAEDKIDKDTLLNLCKKGVVVSYNDAFYQPVSFKDDTSAGCTSLTILTAASTLTTLNSKEYSVG